MASFQQDSKGMCRDQLFQNESSYTCLAGSGLVQLRDHGYFNGAAVDGTAPPKIREVSRPGGGKNCSDRDPLADSHRSALDQVHREKSRLERIENLIRNKHLLENRTIAQRFNDEVLNRQQLRQYQPSQNHQQPAVPFNQHQQQQPKASFSHSNQQQQNRMLLLPSNSRAVVASSIQSDGIIQHWNYSNNRNTVNGDQQILPNQQAIQTQSSSQQQKNRFISAMPHQQRHQPPNFLHHTTQHQQSAQQDPSNNDLLLPEDIIPTSIPPHSSIPTSSAMNNNNQQQQLFLQQQQRQNILHQTQQNYGQPQQKQYLTAAEIAPQQQHQYLLATGMAPQQQHQYLLATGMGPQQHQHSMMMAAQSSQCYHRY